MSETSDFAVKVTGRRCEISGHLTDVTPIEAFESEFRVAREFDLSQLYSISWLGLHRFVTFLEKIETRGSLRNVPAYVHRILVLMGDFSGTITIGTVEVETRHPKKIGITKTVMDFDVLVNNGLLRGAFVEFEEEGLLLDSLHILCRPAFRNHRLPRPNFARNWAVANPQEALFWYEYCSFVRMSIESSGLVVASAVRLLEDSLQSVFKRISAVEAFAKALTPEAKKMARGRVLLEMLARLNELGHSCVQKMQEAKEPFRECCHAMVTSFVDRDTQRNQIYGSVQSVVSALQGLASLTRSLDEVGYETSQGIAQFQERENIVAFLKSLSGEGVSPEKLAVARRKAKISSDKASESDEVDWRSCVRECQQLLASVDPELEGCLLAMQCYDSIRQVLEHRLAEAEYLHTALPALFAKTIEFAEVRKALLEKVGEKLVTDQEKFSFEFFFPEECVIRRNMEAGEVVFFETTKVSEASEEVVKEAS